MNTPPTNLVPKDERASKPVGAPVGSRSQRVDLLRLRDSTQLLVRPIAPTDKRTLATAYSTLSTDSRWLRFSAHAPTLSGRDLAYLTEVDHHTHEALVAIDPSTRAFVGVARYIAIPGSEGRPRSPLRSTIAGSVAVSPRACCAYSQVEPTPKASAAS